jgi:putative transposase
MHPKISLEMLCRLLGISRQAYYQYQRSKEILKTERHLVLREISMIRGLHPAMGGRKLYIKLQPFFSLHGIKMGRDALFDLLAEEGLLVRKQRRSIPTTFSHHWLRKWPNLIKGLTPTSPNQLWVSDITYWKTGSLVLYISLITDAYSHKIVGHHVAQTLETIETIKALRAALPCLEGQASRPIHHSDRGTQYCSSGYVKLLQDNGLAISMTETGDPIENAVAERVNGILKEEYLNYHTVTTLEDAATVVQFVVNLYNQERPHMSIGLSTPEEVHKGRKTTNRLWKTYARKIKHVNQSQD